jgi:amino acid adenylation domain-containing protein
MTDDERQQVVVGNNQTEKEFPRKQCLHELFEAQARRDPESVAVIAGDGSLQYGELNVRANRLAERLRQSGIGPESIVAICLHRSVELVVSLIAVLKAGGAYVPLDPDYPPDRLSLMLADSGAKVLLTQSQFLPALCSHDAEVVLIEGEWATVPDAAICNPRSDVTPGNLAYVIYTSGSTGRPKGAMLDHRGRVNNFVDFNERFHVGAGDRVLALSSPSFDMCAYDVFGTLAAGAAVVMPEREKDRDPKHWAELMVKHGVSIWQSVPALLELLVDGWESFSIGTTLDALRVVLLGGDWIPVTLPERIRRIAPQAQVISLGGATEVSVHSTIYSIEATDPAWTSIPYGKPLTNQLAYVVDSRFEPVPIGVCGELCLGGVGVGRGYYKRPDLTAEKFIPHPFGRPGERLYRTGDLARWLPDGNLELIGRMDHQVKVRGFRIELGEIKTALERHPEVKEAEVVMTGSHAEAKKLVAYIVPKGKAPGASEMQGFLRSTLPGYMVPSAFVMLEALPLSPNGKVDRRALPPPDENAYLKREYEQPRGAMEATLAALWADILKVERVGRNDNFFELGGSSLLAVSLLERMRRKGLVTDVRAVFTAPALSNLAEVTKEIVEIRL